MKKVLFRMRNVVAAATCFAAISFTGCDPTKETPTEENTIVFYKNGESVDIYLNMLGGISTGTYYWCGYDCSDNYFYTQKGVTDGIMWYARKGMVKIEQQTDNKYGIVLYLETGKDSPDGTRIDINGQYNGYLTVE